MGRKRQEVPQVSESKPALVPGPVAVMERLALLASPAAQAAAVVQVRPRREPVEMAGSRAAVLVAAVPGSQPELPARAAPAAKAA